MVGYMRGPRGWPGQEMEFRAARAQKEARQTAKRRVGLGTVNFIKSRDARKKNLSGRRRGVSSAMPWRGYAGLLESLEELDRVTDADVVAGKIVLLPPGAYLPGSGFGKARF